MLKTDKHELVYLIFQGLDGRWIKGADDEIRLTIEFILQNLIAFINDN